MGDRWAAIWRLARLWPEAVLAALTIWLVATDGLRSSAGDPGYYFKIAEQVSQGMIPYRDYPFEYPVVALPPILLPYFLPGGSSYETFLRFLFVENVGFVIAIGAGILWLARSGWSAESWLRSGIVYALLALALAPVVVWRFDALPVLFTVVALVAAARNRPALAGLAVGAGIMAKLYPLAILPALVVGQIANRGLKPALVLAVATFAAVAVIVAPVILISGSGAFSFLPYSTNRGVQIESVPGALALLAATLGGPDAHIFHGFGTFQVDSPLIPMLGSLWTLLTAVVVIALALAIWQRFRTDRLALGGLAPTSQVIHLAAALVVVLVSSRILSPQYLFWVAPFVALLSRPKTLLFWVACLLTTFVYPLNYQQMLNQEPYTVIAVNVRNAILVGFLGWLIAADLMMAVRSLGSRLRST